MTNQPTQTSSDFIAQAYWEDYTKGCPIDGGVAYEQQLRQLRLNGSIESLKQLDAFLMSVRTDIQGKFSNPSKKLSAEQQKYFMLSDDPFRRLLMFIGFYSGKVLANIWKSQCQWYGTQELQKINPTYAVNGDFLQSIGVKYVNQDKFPHLNNTQVARIENPWLFLPLEPIMMRIFGGFDYQIHSVQGEPQVSDGLYQAVMQRLPEQIATQIRQKEQNSQPQMPLNPSNQPSKTDNSATNSFNQSKPSNNLGGIGSQPSKKSYITNDSIEQKNKTYDSLMADIEQINFPQTNGVEQYQKAKQVMQKFDEHVKAQNLPASEVKFSDKHIEARQQALALMKQSADSGNTSAMLHYACYLSTGKWLTLNQAQGVSLIQTAANTKDPRAMRVLSKLHYQGSGVSQDNQLGQYWLNQASDNGHPEAKIVANQMAISQTMMDEHKADMSTDKRHIILIGATLFVGLIIFIIL